MSKPKYKLTYEGVKNTETGACVPEDKANKDWVEYERWLQEEVGGVKNEPEEFETDEELATRQARFILDIQKQIVDVSMRMQEAINQEFFDYSTQLQSKLDGLALDLTKVLTKKKTEKEEKEKP
jgi:hypothetical protein